MIRPFRPADLPAAEAVWRTAFATQLGIAPAAFRPGAAVLARRLAAAPHLAFVAERAGEIAGSILGVDLGSVWLLGPLTVDPARQGQGVAKQLLAAFLAAADAAGVARVGLWTFAHSPLHLTLYGKAGFWPQSLAVLHEGPAAPGPSLPLLSQLAPPARAAALTAIHAQAAALFPGLDLGREIAGGGGDVLLAPAGFALIHAGPGSEASQGQLYVKFATASAPAGLAALLAAAAARAAAVGCARVRVGVHVSRRATAAVLAGLGWPLVQSGVAMIRPDADSWDGPQALVCDDWQ